MNLPVETPPTGAIPDPNPSRVGRGLYVGGALLLAGLAGVGLGYWLSDRGVHWLRTMLPALSALGVLGLLAMAYGSLRLGESGWRRARRRTIAFLALGLLAGVVRLGVHWAARPSPLSTLPVDRYVEVANADEAQYRILVANLEQSVRRLAELPAAEVLDEASEGWALDAWSGFVDAAFALDQLRRYHEDYYRLDLSRLERDRHLRSFLLSFAAELALYQATTQAVEAVGRNPGATKFLELPRPERNLSAGTFTRAREALTGVSDLSRVIAGQRYLDYLDQVHDAATEVRARGAQALYQEVRARLLVLARTQSFREAAQGAVVADLLPRARDAKRWFFPVQAGVAEWMGDTRVRREGRYLIRGELVDDLAQLLEPGDVLLARKNWYLSNLALPGFWPHAALHVGTSEALARAFDLDPEVTAWVQGQGEPRYTEYLKHHFPIAWEQMLRSEAGAAPLVVVEALSEGVSQSPLDHVTGDYVAALRPKLPKLQKAKAIAKAFSFLGRPYDFDFDFATDQSLVCTEVVWRAYRPEQPGEPGLVIPPVTVAGRATLPANQLVVLYAAEKGSAEAQLELVAFIEGREASRAAEVKDEAAFIATATRSKWDLGQP